MTQRPTDDPAVSYAGRNSGRITVHSEANIHHAASGIRPLYAGFSLMLFVGLLLYAAGLRIQHFIEFPVWFDELKILTQASGSLYDTILRIPGDWPPGFGTLLWVWQRFVGPTLEAGRYMSTLFSLLFLVFMYRAAIAFDRFDPETSGPRKRSARAGLLAVSTGAVMAYTIFAGVDLRAYGVMLAVGALAFWLVLRWLKRPALKLEFMLGLAIAALLYLSYTSLPYIAYLTCFVLLMRPRLFWRWAAVGALVLALVLPIIPRFLANSQTRLGYKIALAPFPQEMAEIARDFGGSYWFVALLVIVAGILSVSFIRTSTQRRKILALGGWLLFPAVVYFASNNDVVMKPRYLWWVAIGLIVVFGYGLARLPGRFWLVGLVVLLLLPVIPVNWDANNVYRLSPTDSPPIRDTLSWLAERLRPGDVMVIDPHCTCGSPYMWDYFVPLYFLTGVLPVVDDPGDAARVWYLSTRGWEVDEALEEKVNQGRIAGEFVGPWFFLLRLYEGPPAWEGVTFGDSVAFNGFEIDSNSTYVFSENEVLTVKLWWSAAQPVEADYSISLALFSETGELVAQSDGPARAPQTPEQTSAWQPDVYYEDYRELHIPANVPTGHYTLALTVYQWWDGENLAPGETGQWSLVENLPGYLGLDRLFVMGN